MKARFFGKCSICGDTIRKGENIAWDTERREAQHEKCVGQVDAAYDPVYDADPDGMWERVKRMTAEVARKRQNCREVVNG